jgi:SAM-dependent methyltransferase
MKSSKNDSSPTCRLCERALEHVFVDLGMSPPANSYLRESDLHSMEPFLPLRVYVCCEFKLVQLPEFEAPERIFAEEYLYFSSYSTSWLKHAESLAAMATERFGLGPKSLVVELASNDGYLLQYFLARGVPVLGIEPAANVAKVAVEERKIPTEVRFFDRDAATDLRARGKRADLIVGNNVLAHVPGLRSFVAGMKTLLQPAGVVSVEFPHLEKLVAENQFDTIYHEHYSYFSFAAARAAFATAGLTVFDVEELPTHGGSLRVFARHDEDATHPVTERVGALLDRETAGGYGNLDFYLGYRASVETVKRDLLEFLIDAKRAGKRVVGYGAPAKGNTLLNYCGIREDFLDFTVDRSPHKQGRYLPGTHIPIRAPEAIDEARPDYVLILPWNLRAEITEQLSHVRSWGCRFVVPIPKLEIIE